ncbi:zinc-ribbon domain-containing protein [Methanobrevibacter millerae]|jgi:hypothetical protein|uniref:Zinc-ribbon domain-containing protein n=1 Tax=Methanobrevibacter millerae TaxID=230361 RepID=A0A1G5W9J7_9EURY|nr:zinc-ribbon domain-containing protein [Methanobrevibacter millerae]SDA54743.1 zinc-ribbon domain-containing protein [Methanobrevibacter millerae]
MIICPECGEENPQGSKFCRKCGINLVHEAPPKAEHIKAEKVTVETQPPRTEVKKTTVQTNTSTTTTNNKKDSNDWILCCVCLFFIFIIFAIVGH